MCLHIHTLRRAVRLRVHLNVYKLLNGTIIYQTNIIYKLGIPSEVLIKVRTSFLLSESAPCWSLGRIQVSSSSFQFVYGPNT